MNARCCTIDFESRSACSLKKHGTWRYSIHPSTQILCLVYRLPHWSPGRTAVWHPELPSLGLAETPNSKELAELRTWIAEGGLVEAHNVFFEFCMWRNIMAKRYGWIMIPHSQWRCSAAKAASHALPRSLEGAASALKLAISKDMEGAKIMKKMAVPRKSRKKEREQWAREGVKPPQYLWHESVELHQRLIAYCRMDVLAEEAVSHVLPDLDPIEQQIFEMDLRLNETGFQLDKAAVAVARRLLFRESLLLNVELRKLTEGAVQKATQRTRMLEWLNTQGTPLFDTQKTTLDELLKQVVDDEELPPWVPRLNPKTRRAVEILRALGRSSTAKYQAMQDWMAPDGRVRGGLLYHGASTGRWSGKGIQPHNFPKGTEKDYTMEDLWDALLTGDQAVIDSLGKGVMEVLSNALRGAIVASKGYDLFVADYASIEARVLLWLAGDKEGLDIFRNGEDIYCSMASQIYHRPITKKDTMERQLGKAAVLGCFGPNTLVLTPRGWLPLIAITTTDLVWDGVEWVHHDGLLNQGMQEIMQWRGIQVTPDHKILVGHQWYTAHHLARPENVSLLQLALNTANLPLSASCMASEEALPQLQWSAPVAQGRIGLLKTICDIGEAPDATNAPKRKQLNTENTTSVTPTSCQMMTTENDSLIESVQSSRDAKTRRIATTPIMGDAVYECILNGLRGIVPVVGVGVLPDDVNSWPTFSHCPDGTSPNLNLIEKTTTEGMNLEISDLSLERSTSLTDDRSESFNDESLSWKTVYDIANAGPRHRFTILTSAGPLIVSNCGYQMGGPKFVSTAAMYGVTIEEEFSREVVAAYREKFWRVKQLWYDQEAAAIQAVETGKRVFAGKVTWFTEGKFLYCQLPSGRRLAYPFPEVRLREMPWGEQKAGLTFMGVDGYTHQWKRQTTYGGMIVENIVQAISRDLMAWAMLRADEEGTYRVILSVHDELVAEAPKGQGNVQEFESVMAECPDWAQDCPVEAAGWKGYRYAKG